MKTGAACSFFRQKIIKYHMIGKNRSNNFFSNLIFSIKSTLLECKLKTIFTFIFVLIGLVIGIFVAIRLNNTGNLENACDYGYVETNLAASGIVWRFVSSIIFMALIALLSLNIFLYPITEIVLIYKGYLIGLNIVIILITKGLTGLFLSLLIILPCQIILMMILCCFFCVFSSNLRNCGVNNIKIIGVSLLFLLIVNILESALLLLFGANLLFVA